jgi:RES domain-containing protein
MPECGSSSASSDASSTASIADRPVLVWRITRESYQALDGEGARLYGGRWNSEGSPVVYTSATLALAALEYLVHVDPAQVPDDLCAMGVDVPDDLVIGSTDPAIFPSDWTHVPDHPACLEHGDRWIREATTPALWVPSAVIPQEQNLLINPVHPDATVVTVSSVRAFALDPRLFK